MIQIYLHGQLLVGIVANATAWEKSLKKKRILLEFDQLLNFSS